MASQDLSRIIRDVEGYSFQAEYQPALGEDNNPLTRPEGCNIPPFDDRPLDLQDLIIPDINKECIQPFIPTPIVPIPFFDVDFTVDIPCPDGFQVNNTGFHVVITGNTSSTGDGWLATVSDGCNLDIGANLNLDVRIPCPGGFVVTNTGFNVNISGGGSGSGTLSTSSNGCDLTIGANLNLDIPAICPSFEATGGDPYVSMGIGPTGGDCNFQYRVDLDFNRLKDDLQDYFDDRYCMCPECTCDHTTSTTSTTTCNPCTAPNFPDNPHYYFFEGSTYCDALTPPKSSGWYCCMDAPWPIPPCASGCECLDGCVPICDSTLGETYESSSCTCVTCTPCLGFGPNAHLTINDTGNGTYVTCVDGASINILCDEPANDHVYWNNSNCECECDPCKRDAGGSFSGMPNLVYYTQIGDADQYKTGWYCCPEDVEANGLGGCCSGCSKVCPEDDIDLNPCPADPSNDNGPCCKCETTTKPTTTTTTSTAPPPTTTTTSTAPPPTTTTTSTAPPVTSSTSSTFPPTSTTSSTTTNRCCPAGTHPVLCSVGGTDNWYCCNHNLDESCSGVEDCTFLCGGPTPTIFDRVNCSCGCDPCKDCRTLDVVCDLIIPAVYGYPLSPSAIFSCNIEADNSKGIAIWRVVDNEAVRQPDGSTTGGDTYARLCCGSHAISWDPEGGFYRCD
jgi:hypothetical protein